MGGAEAFRIMKIICFQKQFPLLLVPPTINSIFHAILGLDPTLSSQCLYIGPASVTPGLRQSISRVRLGLAKKCCVKRVLKEDRKL